MKRYAVLPLGLLMTSCGFFGGEVGDVGGSIVNRSAAERACVAQAQQESLDILRVVVIQPVYGSGGVVTGRDVTLEVSRGGERYEVRCNYTNESGEARIMSL